MNSLERSYMDRWARWRERNRYEDVGWPKETPLSRQMRYFGVDDGPIHATEEPDTTEEELGEDVQAFMDGLRQSHPKIHLCLEARHRRVVGTLRAQDASEFRLAEICGLPRDRFRDLCDFGYDMLRRWMT